MIGAKRTFLFILLISVVLALAACGGGAAPAAPQATQAPASGSPAAPGQPAATQPEAAQPTEPAGPVVPEIVPIVEGAIDLKVTGDGSYIAYLAPDTTVEAVTTFYQEQLATLGWVQKNKKDSGFGDSITLLRSHEDYNISVTLQTISGSSNIRVLITLIPK